MVSNPIQQALVLATAAAELRGRRHPTALVKTGGITQLRRTLLTLRREGVRRFVIVTGASDRALRAHVAGDAQLAGLDIVWVHNVERPEDVGYGVLLARPHLRGAFYLASVDRVFSAQVLQALLREPLDGATLAVSKDRHSTTPLVSVQGTRVRFGADAGPTAHSFTGIASADGRLVDALSKMHDEGRGTDLHEAFGRLAALGQLRVAEIGSATWSPVTNESDRKQAQSMLLAALRKSVDGLISRHINRRFSLAMTRILMHTPVRPNHVTAFALLVSIAAAVTASFATAATTWWLLVGAVLWQLASMLDGIDGELARLKFTESKIGEWFDTLTDDIGKFAFFIGSGVGVSAATGQSIWLQICVLAVLAQLAVAMNLYRLLLKAGSGSHFALAWEVETWTEPTWKSRLYRKIQVVGRRDYYVFTWMCLTAVGLISVAIAVMFITTAVITTQEVLKPRQVREDFPALPPAG